MNTSKATCVMVRPEVGEHKDYIDAHNNHRITVVRLDTGHVGLMWEEHDPAAALRVAQWVRDTGQKLYLAGDGVSFGPRKTRIDIISPYPLCGALPSYAEACAMQDASKRD